MTSQWNIDLSHSSINFSVRHLMVAKVRGSFGKWSGTLDFDEANPAAGKVRVEIDASSIDTKDEARDTHLRSQDFLDVETYPQLVFQSTGVEVQGERRYRVRGDLTVHGHTEPVTLDVDYEGRVKDPWGGERVVFSARTSLERKKFGLTWNLALETGGVVVGDKVEIELEIEAVKQA